MKAELAFQEDVIRSLGDFAVGEKPEVFADYDGPVDNPLEKRKAGRRMLMRAEPGDVVIASSFDRLFLEVEDARLTLNIFRQRGVSVWIAKPKVNISADVNVVEHILIGFASGVLAERERRRGRHRAPGRLEPKDSKPRSHLEKYPWIKEEVLRLRAEDRPLREIARQISLRQDASYSTIYRIIKKAKGST